MALVKRQPVCSFCGEQVEVWACKSCQRLTCQDCYKIVDGECVHKPKQLARSSEWSKT